MITITFFLHKSDAEMTDQRRKMFTTIIQETRVHRKCKVKISQLKLIQLIMLIFN